jgi:hypothetical protein
VWHGKLGKREAATCTVRDAFAAMRGKPDSFQNLVARRRISPDDSRTAMLLKRFGALRHELALVSGTGNDHGANDNAHKA